MGYSNRLIATWRSCHWTVGEVSDLALIDLAQALGVDPRQLFRRRSGAEPCSGAMHSTFRFASRIPGDPGILNGVGQQRTPWNEENQARIYLVTRPTSSALAVK